MPAMEANGEEEEQAETKTLQENVQREDEKQDTESETESWPSLHEVEEMFGYEFNDKSLLEAAFTHASFSGAGAAAPTSYERLEYVGDAVLNLLFAKEHYFLYPELSPGSLTQLRSVNVDTEKLARVALRHGLHRYLRHRKPLLEEQIQDFRKKIIDHPLHSNRLIDAPKALADIVESSIGAVFIDSNSSLDTVWQVFKSLLEPIITPKTIKRNATSELYELCQKKGWKLDLVTDIPNRTIDFFIEDRLMGRATYEVMKKKLVAQNRAAKAALIKIESMLSEMKIVDDYGSLTLKHMDQSIM